MIPLEHLSTMGLPVFPEMQSHCGYTVPFQRMLDNRDLSSAQVKALAGNAISIPVIGAVFMYCLMNFQYRESDPVFVPGSSDSETSEIIPDKCFSSSPSAAESTDAQPR
jgi:hypothetical protein